MTLTDKQLLAALESVKKYIADEARKLSYGSKSIDIEDLIATGTVAAIETLKNKWDPTSDVKPISVVSWPVKNAMTALFGSSATAVSIPRGKARQIGSATKTLESIDDENKEKFLGSTTLDLSSLTEHDIQHFVKKLNAREKYIFEHRLLADKEDKQSLKEIGQHLNISHERVRQIENEIRIKLGAKRKNKKETKKLARAPRCGGHPRNIYVPATVFVGPAQTPYCKDCADKLKRNPRSAHFSVLGRRGGLAVVETYGPEFLKEISKSHWQSLTTEQRHDRAVSSASKLTPEQLHERSILSASKLTPEQRHAKAVLGVSKLTPQQRREKALLGWATRKSKKGQYKKPDEE